MGEAKHPAAAMYQRLSNNSFMQIEVALAVILSEQPSEDVRLKYEGTIAYMKSIKGRRDRLAHWLYSSFSEEPDAVILIDPKHALEHFFLSRGGNMLPLRKHAFIYGEKEFAEIYSEFQNVTKALHILLEFGRNQDAATLSQLSSMPQIQRAIDKILRGRNAQQEHQEQPDKPLPA